jgi:hypothetical protein
MVSSLVGAPALPVGTEFSADRIRFKTGVYDCCGLEDPSGARYRYAQVTAETFLDALRVRRVRRLLIEGGLVDFAASAAGEAGSRGREDGASDHSANEPLPVADAIGYPDRC